MRISPDKGKLLSFKSPTPNGGEQKLLAQYILINSSTIAVDTREGLDGINTYLSQPDGGKLVIQIHSPSDIRKSKEGEIFETEGELKLAGSDFVIQSISKNTKNWLPAAVDILIASELVDLSSRFVPAFRLPRPLNLARPQHLSRRS